MVASVNSIGGGLSVSRMSSSKSRQMASASTMLNTLLLVNSPLKLAATGAMIVGITSILLGLGEVPTNNASDYRRDISDFEMFLAKVIPVVVVPTFLLANFTLGMLNGMSFRWAYLPM